MPHLKACTRLRRMIWESLLIESILIVISSITIFRTTILQISELGCYQSHTVPLSLGEKWCQEAKDAMLNHELATTQVLTHQWLSNLIWIVKRTAYTTQPSMSLSAFKHKKLINCAVSTGRLGGLTSLNLPIVIEG